MKEESNLFITNFRIKADFICDQNSTDEYKIIYRNSQDRSSGVFTYTRYRKSILSEDGRNFRRDNRLNNIKLFRAEMISLSNDLHDIMFGWNRDINLIKQQYEDQLGSGKYEAFQKMLRQMEQEYGIILRTPFYGGLDWKRLNLILRPMESIVLNYDSSISAIQKADNGYLQESFDMVYGDGTHPRIMDSLVSGLGSIYMAKAGNLSLRARNLISKIDNNNFLHIIEMLDKEEHDLYLSILKNNIKPKFS